MSYKVSNNKVNVNVSTMRYAYVMGILSLRVSPELSYEAEDSGPACNVCTERNRIEGSDEKAEKEEKCKVIARACGAHVVRHIL